jgi:tight adherence protein B
VTRQWPAVVALLVAAIAIAAPAGAGRRRRRRRRASVLGLPARRGRRLSGPGGLAARAWRLRRAPGAPAVAAVAAVLTGVPALAAGGPVAALVAAAYTALVVRGLRRHARTRQHSAQRVSAVDALGALAADLRAGLPPAAIRPPSTPAPIDGPDAVDETPPAPAVWQAPEARRLAALAGAAVRLAEGTGAPLADLVERIEADARATDRAVAAAAAQAAGARATAWLLAALPLGGIALGYGIGVDPLHVLLRTRVGAGCAVAAVVLQVGGLAWADRLARVPRTPGLGADPARDGRPAGAGAGVTG